MLVAGLPGQEPGHRGVGVGPLGGRQPGGRERDVGPDGVQQLVGGGGAQLAGGRPLGDGVDHRAEDRGAAARRVGAGLAARKYCRGHLQDRLSWRG